MSKLTFSELDRNLFKFYEEKAYQQVLALIEQEQANFPEHVLELSYWCICMTNLLGKQEEALQLFREAVDQGYWFDPAWLVEDEDLAAARHLPEFRSLVAVCQQHLVEAQAVARPELLVFPSDHQPAPLLIVLHGNRGNAHSTSEEWRGITQQGWLLAVPQSSQIVGQ